MMPRPGPGYEQDEGHAGGGSDREALQQGTAVLRLRRRAWPGARRQALVDACGYFPSTCQGTGHDRVAVVGAQLMVCASGGANVIGGQRRSTHEAD